MDHGGDHPILLSENELILVVSALNWAALSHRYDPDGPDYRRLHHRLHQQLHPRLHPSRWDD